MRINETFMDFNIEDYGNIDYLAENYENDLTEDDEYVSINEALGSMQIPDNTSYVKFIDGIIDDLENGLYKDNIVHKQSLNKSPLEDFNYINSFEYQIFKNFKYANSYYIKEYIPTGVDWLGKLYVVVIDSYPDQSIDAMAMIDTDILKSYSKDKIDFATLCVINPTTKILSRKKVYHEMSHIYKDWKEIKNSSKYKEYELRKLITKDFVAFNKFFKHRTVSSLFYDETFVEYLKSICLKNNPTRKDVGAVIYSLYLMMYFLNKSEISAHIEDVVLDIRTIKKKYPNKEITFSDLCDESETLRLYMGIKDVLISYTENVNTEVIDALEYYCKDFMLDVYYAYNKRERMGTVGNVFKHVAKKLFDKINAFERKVYKQIYYFNGLK